MAWLNQNDLHLPWWLPFIISHFNDSSFLCFAYRRMAMMFLSELNEKLYALSWCLFSITWDCIKISIDISLLKSNLSCLICSLVSGLEWSWKQTKKKKKATKIILVFLELFLRIIEFPCFKWKHGSDKFGGYIIGLLITQV